MARQRIPSSLRSKIQFGSENGVSASTAFIGSITLSSSSMVRPLTTDSGRSATGSGPSASSSRRFTSSQRRPSICRSDQPPLELLALEPEGGVSGGERLLHRFVAQVLVAAAVPDDHRPRAVLALRDHALEVAPRERVVVNGHREPLVARVHRRALRDRPGSERSSHLEPEVVVHARRVMLLDHEARHSRPVPRSSGWMVSGPSWRVSTWSVECEIWKRSRSSSASSRRCACVSQPARTVT